jgi:hypothetical protein
MSPDDTADRSGAVHQTGQPSGAEPVVREEIGFPDFHGALATGWSFALPGGSQGGASPLPATALKNAPMRLKPTNYSRL